MRGETEEIPVPTYVFMLEDVLLDLDSLYAQYTQDTRGGVYQFIEHGQPIESSVFILRALLNRGYDIRILTQAKSLTDELRTWIKKNVSAIMDVEKSVICILSNKDIEVQYLARQLDIEVLGVFDSTDEYLAEYQRIAVPAYIVNRAYEDYTKTV